MVDNVTGFYNLLWKESVGYSKMEQGKRKETSLTSLISPKEKLIEENSFDSKSFEVKRQNG